MKNLLISSLLFFSTLALKADEGMWLLNLLNNKQEKIMQEKGLQLSLEQIADFNKASLKDAVVSFGGFCTGAFISKSGLLLTNHHCAYAAIQKVSSLENNYLNNGFWAKNQSEELPINDLHISILEKIDDVSARMFQGIDSNIKLSERKEILKQNQKIIED